MNRINALTQRHSVIEAEITEETKRPRPNDEKIGRLKIEKLHIKDEIERIRGSHE